MSIPPLEEGVLPEGIHECTFEELREVFGRAGRSDQRATLTERLDDYLKEARRAGIVAAVIIDGSYITAKERPNDIDLLVALRADFDLAQ